MSTSRSVFAGFLKVARQMAGDFIQVDIDTKPVPASRPRVSKWGTYYAKTYRNWRDEAHKLLQEARSKHEPDTGPLLVFTEIVYPRPKSTKRAYPHGDNDNYEKAAWDVITRDERWWNDDDQIVLNVTTKRYTDKQETPGTRLHIFELENEA